MKWALVSNCCSRETAAAADLADHTSAEIGVWIETHTHSIMFLYMEYLHNRVESKALSHILNIIWKIDIKWGSQSTHYWVQESDTVQLQVQTLPTQEFDATLEKIYFGCDLDF